MAKNEIVNVLTVKTEQSQNTIKGLKKEIADLKKNLESAEIGSEEFSQASKDLAKAQAELKTVMADGRKTTDAVEGSYNHLTATMAELKKEWRATADEVKRNDLGQQIDNINSQLKDMDASIGNFQRNVGNYANSFKDAFEQQQKSTENVRIGLDGLQKTAAGLASGYAAVQGVMNLLNIESSKFEETMIKVQSAMAVAQGIGGMKDLIEGGGTLITIFKGATTGAKTFITGLGGVKKAIASTGIGLLVVAIGTLITNWDTLTAKLKEIGVFDKLKANIMGIYNVLKTYLLAPFKALGEIISGDFKAGIEELKQAFKFAENFNAGKIADQEKQATNAILETAKQSALATENYIKDQEAKLGSDWKYTKEGIAAYRKFYNEKLSLYQKDSDDYKNTQRSLWSFERELREKNTTTPEPTTEEKVFTPERQEGILSQISSRLDTEVALFGMSRDRMLVLDGEMRQKMLAQINEFAIKETKRIREEAEKQRAIKEMVKQSSLSIASDALGSLSSIIGEETAVGKAAAIAQTTIDTYQSATAAYKSLAGIPVVGPALGAAAATAAALAGAANIKKILAVRTDGVSNGNIDTSTSMPSSPRVDLSQSMPVQYTRDLLSDSELSNINQEQKVYVTETDITNTQNKVRVAESNASF